MKRMVSMLLSVALLLGTGTSAMAGCNTQRGGNNLLAHWSFDNITNSIVTDETGNGHNGRVAEGELISVDGVSGSALEFGTDKQIVIVDNSDDFKFSKSSNFTISLWARSNGDFEKWQSIIQMGRRGGSDHYGVWLPPSNNIQFCTINNERIGMTAMPQNEWINFTVVHDGSNGYRSIYVNGRFIEKHSTVDMGNQSGALTIGGIGGGAGEIFDGSIDEVKIFGNALSATDVLEIFAENGNAYSISGSVTYKKTGTAAGQTEVMLMTADKDEDVIQTAVTDSNGKYDFTGVEDGNYILGVNADKNHGRARVAITVNNGDAVYNIGLPEVETKYSVTFNTVPKSAKIRVTDSTHLIVSESDGSYSLEDGTYNYTVRADGYTSKTGTIEVKGKNAELTVELTKKDSTVNISSEDVYDHIKGGWIGEMAGVTWGGPTEFGYKRCIIPLNKVPQWKPETILEVYEQDDLCAEIPILQCMDKYGVTAGWNRLGEYWANNKIWIIGANGVARSNLQNGIPAPESGHYKNNGCCDDIDWQIDADSMGMIACGQPEVAKELAWRVGHLMGYGDGVYGGVFVASMYAAALTAGSVDEIIDVGLSGIPKDTKFYRTLQAVIDSYESGATWKETWEVLETPEMQEWRSNFSQRVGVDMNMSAKINSAYILIGLLYGGGDFEKSMEISMRCGQDSDCNPSSAGGILGYYLGAGNLDEKWYSALDFTKKFHETTYSVQDSIDVTYKLSKEVVQLTGGKTTGDKWSINRSTGNKKLIREQWPEDSSNAMPTLKAEVKTNKSDSAGRTYDFSAYATDSDGIEGYQWFFGDLTFSNGSGATHTYSNDGVYNAVCYVTDKLGNTSYKEFKVYVNTEEEDGLIAHWTFDKIDGNKVVDVSGNGHDGTISGSPSFVEGVTGKAVQFTGDGQLITAAADTSFAFGKASSYTLAAWVKRTKDNGGWQAIFQTGRRSNSNYYGLWIANGDRFDFGGKGSQSQNIYSGSDYLKDKWYHITLVQDGEKGTRVLYVNGKNVGTGSSDSGLSGEDFTIGGVGGSVGEYFKGFVDDLRIYNVALSQSKINDIISEPADGDVNNDGKVNILDLIRLKKHCLNKIAPLDIPRADLNGDAAINSLDLTMLRHMLLTAVASKENDPVQTDENTLYHIVLLGQSLSMGYATESCLPGIENENAFMYKRVRTQDFGYVFGISGEQYAANTEQYENAFYSELKPLCETGGDGNRSTQWESASWNEYETPASGIVQGLTNAYVQSGKTGLPYKVLVSAPGIGGTAINRYTSGTKIYERAKKDIENGKILADKKGLKYKVLAVVWMQGEDNYADSESGYYSQLLNITQQYRKLIKNITGQTEDVPFVSYQTMGQQSYYEKVSQNPALAQFAAAASNNGFYITSPCYQFQTYSDKIHMTNVSSRNMGILLGNCLFDVLNEKYKLFQPNVSVSGDTAVLSFPFEVKIDLDGVLSSHNKSALSENKGFFCYDSNGNSMQPTISLGNDNRTLTIKCKSEINKITYGYDVSANEYARYTFGGAIRTNADIRGYNGNIGCYMPIQNIYG